MCHAPAEMFQIADRGYLDEGYWADIVLLDPLTTQTITNQSVLYKCSWTPLDGTTLKGRVHSTFINGQLAYQNGQLHNTRAGQRLLFNR
jgi:dihydroorotase